MKKIIIILISIVSISCSNSQKTAFSKEALSEKLTAINGEQIVFDNILKPYKGKTLVIEVWASWCGDCVKAMPKIHELQANNPEATYLFISMDKSVVKWKDAISKFDLKEAHFRANDQMKGVFAKAIDLDWIPRYLVIDKTGKIVLYKAIETDFEQINSTLKELQK